MFCEKCRTYPQDVGSNFCSLCQKSEQLPIPTSKNGQPPNSPSSLSSAIPTGPVVRTQNNTITGSVVSYTQLEKYESLGKRLFNAIRLRDRWSFDPQIHHLRLRTEQNELYYIIIFGHLKGNYLFVEKQDLEVEGTFNENNQFTARSLKDVGTGVSYKINSFPYQAAIALMSFHLCLAFYLSYLIFRYSHHLLVSLIVVLTYLVVLFTSKKSSKK